MRGLKTCDAPWLRPGGRAADFWLRVLAGAAQVPSANSQARGEAVRGRSGCAEPARGRGPGRSCGPRGPAASAPSARLPRASATPEPLSGSALRPPGPAAPPALPAPSVHAQGPALPRARASCPRICSPLRPTGPGSPGSPGRSAGNWLPTYPASSSRLPALPTLLPARCGRRRS